MFTAIRSGDYYMFDDLEDEEELDLIEETESIDDHEEEEESFNRRPTVSEVSFASINFMTTDK